MAEKYKAPFWLKQLLIGTAHPAMLLLMEYYDAERERATFAAARQWGRS